MLCNCVINIENKTVTKVISKMEGNEKDEENLGKILEKVKKVDDTCDYKGCKQVCQVYSYPLISS
jgi:hypothetical protein